MKRVLEFDSFTPGDDRAFYQAVAGPRACALLNGLINVHLRAMHKYNHDSNEGRQQAEWARELIQWLVESDEWPWIERANEE
ncbi:MAG: hypothetical protein GY851_07280 [bacterium]|nr:hypothetical protein [bacterium]